jgi:hypothetical protein
MGIYFQHLQAMKNGTASKTIKVAKPLARESAKKKAANKAEKPERELQDEWFDTIENAEWKNGITCCWNCGTEIPQVFARSSTAHLVPKRNKQFPSVARHPLNYAILGGACGCHNEYDNMGWENAADMQVWPVIAERFQQVYLAMAPEEKYRLPKQLTETLVLEAI